MRRDAVQKSGVVTDDQERQSEFRRNCSNQRCVGLSRWLVGSSSMSTSGFDKSKCASATRMR